MAPTGHQPTRRALLGTAAAVAAFGPARAAQPPRLTFEGLYQSIGVRGMVFADQVTALTGKKVAMAGYMAPPLKPESNFFVLTREPLALCPFCQSDADWPVDIVVVYLRRAVPMSDAGTRLLVTGRLQAGTWTDPETGFVSLLRIVDASFDSI